MVDVQNWGSTAAERSLPLGCDEVVPNARQVLNRAMSSSADPAALFRWVCQIKVAPYSYDLVDNFGKRSPQTLTPGADELVVGDTWCRVFRLSSFTDSSVTITAHSRPLRLMTSMTYAVLPVEGGSRLLARIAVDNPGGLYDLALRSLLPAGDLVMIRRQMLNLTGLAERGV